MAGNLSMREKTEWRRPRKGGRGRDGNLGNTRAGGRGRRRGNSGSRLVHDQLKESVHGSRDDGGREGRGPGAGACLPTDRPTDHAATAVAAAATASHPSIRRCSFVLSMVRSSFLSEMKWT